MAVQEEDERVVRTSAGQPHALLPAAAAADQGNGPNPRSLTDVASWSVERLVSADKVKLAALPRRLHLGTACSGSDCPAVVLQRLCSALRAILPYRAFEVEHVFSCEREPAKQKFTRGNFPELRALFNAVTKLGLGKAMNVWPASSAKAPASRTPIARTSRAARRLVVERLGRHGKES